MELAIGRAGLDDVERVRDVLDEASAWLRARGIEQWPDRWEDRWFVPAIEAGETWLARRGARVAGTVTLQAADETIWPGAPPVACYVHRLAVTRAAAGAGRVLLDWAERATAESGRALVRLDCWSDNRRLRAYYEAAGYGFVGEASEDTWTVARYEKRVR